MQSVNDFWFSSFFSFLFFFSFYFRSRCWNILNQWTNILHRPFFGVCVYFVLCTVYMNLVWRNAHSILTHSTFTLDLNLYCVFFLLFFVSLSLEFCAFFLFSSNFQLLFGYLSWSERYRWWWNTWAGERKEDWLMPSCRVGFLYLKKNRLGRTRVFFSPFIPVNQWIFSCS